MAVGRKVTLVDYSLTPAKSDRQFKRAQELGAANVAKLARSADGALTVKLRNLKTREEKSVSLADSAQELFAARP